MKIALINGSPKISHSTSGALSTDLKKHLCEHGEITEIGLHESTVSDEVVETLQDADTFVFLCPLYVDGIPGHLLSCLVRLEKVSWKKQNVAVYGIVNCGFYEGIQAEYALEVLQNWCVKTGFIWGGGIGVGGGGGLAQMPTIENGHGPKAPIENAIKALANNILQQKNQENDYVSVAFPRFLYRIAAQMGWRQMIRANGGKVKDLKKRF